MTREQISKSINKKLIPEVLMEESEEGEYILYITFKTDIKYPGSEDIIYTILSSFGYGVELYQNFYPLESSIMKKTGIYSNNTNYENWDYTVIKENLIDYIKNSYELHERLKND